MFHGSLEFPTKNLRMSPNPVDLKDCKQLQTALEPRICSAFLSCFCAGDLLSQFRTYWTDWSYWLWPKDPWVSRHFRNLWISWIYEVLGATNLHPTIQSECRSLIKGLWCTWHHPKNCDRPKLDRQKPDICTYPNAEVPHHRQPNISKAKSWASIFTNDIPSHWSWFAINHISFWTTLDSITTFTTTSYIYIYIKYEHKYIYICVYIYINTYIYIYPNSETSTYGAPWGPTIPAAEARCLPWDWPAWAVRETKRPRPTCSATKMIKYPLFN